MNYLSKILIFLSLMMIISFVSSNVTLQREDYHKLSLAAHKQRMQWSFEYRMELYSGFDLPTHPISLAKSLDASVVGHYRLFKTYIDIIAAKDIQRLQFYVGVSLLESMYYISGIHLFYSREINNEYLDYEKLQHLKLIEILGKEANFFKDEQWDVINQFFSIINDYKDVEVNYSLKQKMIRCGKFYATHDQNSIEPFTSGDFDVDVVSGDVENADIHPSTSKGKKKNAKKDQDFPFLISDPNARTKIIRENQGSISQND